MLGTHFPKRESPTEPVLSSAKWLAETVQLPPLQPKNLIRLGEDLLHTSLAYIPADPPYDREKGGRYLSSISDLISRGRTSPTGLSSAEAEALDGTFREVLLPHWVFPRSLILPMVRPYIPCPSDDGTIPYSTHGSDFTATSSSVNRESSPV